MHAEDELIESLRNFNDCEIRVYTRFATEWRDQRLTDGSQAEVAFWNSVISMLVEERHRRKEEVQRLEAMFHTGQEPG